jgi:quinol monooxygenase YgiN
MLEIGTNMKTDQLGTEIDLVVYGEFDDEAALAAYKIHPDYQRSIERVRPIRELRIAADFDSDVAVKQPLG